MNPQPISGQNELLLGDSRFRLKDGMLYDEHSEPVALRAKSLLFLKTLLKENGRVVSKPYLAEAVWPGLAVTDESISQCVADVRRLLKDGSRDVLETFPKQGYRINARIVENDPADPVLRKSVVLAAGFAVLLGVAILGWSQFRPAAQITLLREVVAILPFHNENSTGTAGHFAPGLAEDLTVRLAELSGIQVVPSSLSFSLGYDAEPVGAAQTLDARYVVQGSVRYADQKVWISIELIDGQKGTISWAGNFEDSQDRLMEIRDELVAEIATAVSNRLSQPDRTRIETTGTNFPSAYQELLQGRRAAGQFSLEQSHLAERHFRRAIEIDPTYARAYAELAAVYAIRFENGWTVLSAADEQKALFFAARALEIDPDLWLAHYASGRLYSVIDHKDIDKAEMHLKRAMSLQPANDDARVYYGAVINMQGNSNEAISIVQAVVDSHFNSPFWYHFTLAHSLFQAQRYTEAAAALDRCLHQMPSSPYCLRTQIANYAKMGKIEDAKWSLEEYAALGFDPTINSIMNLIADQNPGNRARMESAFRKAGLPE